MKRGTKRLFKWTSLLLGLAIIFGTHIHILASALPAHLHKMHAIANIVAGFLVLVYVLMSQVR